MQDRVPLYPGRVTLTPVSGQANTYDLTRADQPTQEGTPLNKASLLKDATAALFGETNAAVPDDILSLLSKSALAQIKEKYTKTTIGTVAVGKTITLNVSGTPKEFIVVHQGKPSSLYDDSCNGTWLLMKDIYENRAWHSSNSNSYKASTIHSYLNGTFLGLLDSNTQKAVKQVKIPYVNGTGGSAVASGANGLPAKIFLLSGYEVGWTTSDNQNFPQDGAKLSYFESGTGTSANNKRIANLNGSAAYWWLRSPLTDGASYVWRVSSSGDYGGLNASVSYGIRPALILPSTFAVYTDSSGNIYAEPEYEITDVLGNLIQIPASQIKDGVKIATGSYTGTGTYGSSSPNSLTFAFEPKLVFMFKDKFPVYGSVSSTTSHPVYGTTIGMTTAYSKSLFNIYGRRSGDDYYLYAKKSSDGKTLSWYHGAGANDQMNGSGATYQYIAIG